MLTFETLHKAVTHPQGAVARFASLIEPCTDDTLTAMARDAAALTRRHFGKTMRLFIPLYVSNTCVNACVYCGFARQNEIPRRVLTFDEIKREAACLAAQGFRSILLVAGEHPRDVSTEFLESIIADLKPSFPSVVLEIAPQDTANYRRLVAAGAEGLVNYQETYLPELYATLHPAGPKKNYDWRLQTPERAAEAGFSRVGIGALLGLAPWREEMLLLAAHLDYLQRIHWQTHFTVSFPRLRPASGGYEPPHPLGDREFIQLVCAFRIAFPQAGLVMSTRESPALRDLLAPLGLTMMSAGARTNPGGYSAAVAAEDTGRDEKDIRDTKDGASIEDDTQFCVADSRDAATVTARLRELGLDPVWKDWDAVIG